VVNVRVIVLVVVVVVVLVGLLARCFAGEPFYAIVIKIKFKFYSKELLFAFTIL